MFKANKFLTASILVATLSFASCEVIKNEVSNSAITWENANYIQTSNLNEVKSYYNAVVNWMDKAIEETEYTVEENKSVWEVKSTKEILELLDFSSISSKSASYIDFETLGNTNEQSKSNLDTLKSSFATDQTIQMDSIKLSSIIKWFVNGMRAGSSMTQEQIDELIEESNTKFDDYKTLFYEGKWEKLIGMIENDAKMFWSIVYSDIVSDLSEESRIEINEQLKNNLIINEGAVNYSFNPNKKLGGSLDKNIKYNDLIAHLKNEEIIYQIYFNYEDLFKDNDGENKSIDKILNQSNSSLILFAMLSGFQSNDIKNIMDLLLSGDSIAISLTKSENTIKFRIDIHSIQESKEKANILIWNFEKTLTKFLSSQISSTYIIEKLSTLELSSEQMTYIQEILANLQIISTYSEDNFFTIGYSINLKDENYLQELITDLTAKNIKQTFIRDYKQINIEDEQIENNTTPKVTSDKDEELTWLEETIKEWAANTADSMEKAGNEIQEEADEISDTIEKNAEELSDDAKETVDNISSELDNIVDDIVN